MLPLRVIKLLPIPTLIKSAAKPSTSSLVDQRQMLTEETDIPDHAEVSTNEVEVDSRIDKDLREDEETSNRIVVVEALSHKLHGAVVEQVKPPTHDLPNSSYIPKDVDSVPSCSPFIDSDAVPYILRQQFISSLRDPRPLYSTCYLRLPLFYSMHSRRSPCADVSFFFSFILSSKRKVVALRIYVASWLTLACFLLACVYYASRRFLHFNGWMGWTCAGEIGFFESFSAIFFLIFTNEWWMGGWRWMGTCVMGDFEGACGRMEVVVRGLDLVKGGMG